MRSRSISWRCINSFRSRNGSCPECDCAIVYGAMCRLWSHASPPSIDAQESLNCTFDSRSDFTSLPRSTMPASKVSVIAKLRRA